MAVLSAWLAGPWMGLTSPAAEFGEGVLQQEQPSTCQEQTVCVPWRERCCCGEQHNCHRVSSEPRVRHEQQAKVLAEQGKSHAPLEKMFACQLFGQRNWAEIKLCTRCSLSTPNSVSHAPSTQAPAWQQGEGTAAGRHLESWQRRGQGPAGSRACFTWSSNSAAHILQVELPKPWTATSQLPPSWKRIVKVKVTCTISSSALPAYNFNKPCQNCENKVKSNLTQTCFIPVPKSFKK